MRKVALFCVALVLALGAVGASAARFSDTATMTVTLTTGEWEVGGSPGFWDRWDKHKTYTDSEILDFLDDIRGASDWLDDVTDIGEMQAVFDAGKGKGASMEEKFLGHYLATRLNAEAGRLYPETFHHFSVYDPSNYLGLGGQGTLEQIIGAIESKYGTPAVQFDIMKGICEALNELDT